MPSGDTKKVKKAVKRSPVVKPAPAAAAPAEEDDGVLVIHSDSDESEVVFFPEEFAKDFQDGPKVVGGFLSPEEETDSSEEDPLLNRIGDVPLAWYNDEEHIGYDVEGKKLLKKERSALERLLDATDDPNAMRTIQDLLHDEKKVLSNEDLAVIFNLQRNRFPEPTYDQYADYGEDYVEFDPLNHPLARNGPSKKKFVPRSRDMKIVQKMVKRILSGKLEKGEFDDGMGQKEDDNPYMLWDDDVKVEMDTHTKFKYFNRIPKPSVIPPGTYESYRPPPEYIPSATTQQRHMALRKIDRKEHFLPKQFASLRHVPFYNHTLQDRYQRCLDLCMFPRRQRTRLRVDPNKLLPDLPNPKDLRPYPERLSFVYKGHTATVRSVSVAPSGQYIATGCDDHVVRIFEVQTGRLMKRYDMGNVVQKVEFCPSKKLNILAVAVEFTIVFVVPTFCAHQFINEHSISFLRSPALMEGAPVDAAPVGGEQSLQGRSVMQTVQDKDEQAYETTGDLHDEEEKEKRAEFLDCTGAEKAAGFIVKAQFHARVKKFTFHNKGDYLCALCPKDHVKYRQTVMLQLSRRKVFCPFRKFGEVVTDCRFHPTEPLFFLSTTNSVRQYNLIAHRLQKKYRASGGITTCIDVHPEGEHFLVGDSTHHTSWFDTNFSDKPYKRMKSHKHVVNAVAFHPNTAAYPLFASASADRQVHIFHGMVFDDYNRNAMLVPLKILKHLKGVYDCKWHPTLPWLFTTSDDGTVSCWTE